MLYTYEYIYGERKRQQECDIKKMRGREAKIKDSYRCAYRQSGAKPEEREKAQQKERQAYARLPRMTGKG